MNPQVKAGLNHNSPVQCFSLAFHILITALAGLLCLSPQAQQQELLTIHRQLGTLQFTAYPTEPQRNLVFFTAETAGGRRLPLDQLPVSILLITRGHPPRALPLQQNAGRVFVQIPDTVTTGYTLQLTCGTGHAAFFIPPPRLSH